jgi:glucan phosphoethanolaminetransferase (alkaline phosphatase superfamily)
MWQRIQTLFLVLVVVSMTVSLFLPIWKFTEGAKEFQLYPLHFTTIENDQRITAYFPYSITAILMVVAATLAIIEIRRFDNRLTQIKIGTLNSLVLAGVMICVVVFYNNVTKEYGYGRYGLSLWIPFIGVAGNWLAMRFIRRDEKLVRDSDRIR